MSEPRCEKWLKPKAPLALPEQCPNIATGYFQPMDRGQPDGPPYYYCKEHRGDLGKLMPGVDHWLL